MISIRNENLTATLEAFFLSSQPFDLSYLQPVAAKALEQFRDFGLNSKQIRLRNGDELFDYDLSVFLFNYQAQIKFEADRLFVNVKNAKGARDIDILAQTLVGATECLSEEKIERFTFQVASHAVFNSKSEYKDFFGTFVDKEKDIIDGGKIFSVQRDQWISPIRVALEKSLVFKGAVFLSCSIEQAGAVNLDVIRTIADNFESAINSAGLKIEFE